MTRLDEIDAMRVESALGYDAMVRVVAEGIGVETGAALYERLTASLGQALDADVCFVARLERDASPARFSTVSVWRRDGVRESIVYPAEGSLSAEVLSRGALTLPTNASAHCPTDSHFRASCFEAYAGVAVRDRFGAPIGVLAVMSRRPFSTHDPGVRVLELFSRRIAAEMDRQDTEAKLRAAVEALRRARDQHAVAERRIRDVAELSSDWFWETDAEHRFVYLSETVSGVSGVLADSYRGLTRRQLLGHMIEAESLDVLDLFEALHEAREPYRDVVYAVMGQDGRRRWVSVSGRPIFDAAGAFVGYRGAGADITALRDAREEADRAARRLREGVDAMTTGFALFDPAQRLVMCNALFVEFCALPPGESLTPGAHFGDIIRRAHAAGAFGELVEDVEALVARRVAEHAAGDGRPTEMRLAGGRWLELRDRRTADGGVVSVRTDVTDRKHAERLLLDAIESVPVGFIMCDPDDNFLLCNQRYRDLYPELTPRLKRGFSFTEICELCGDLVDADGRALPFDVWLRQRLERHHSPQGPVQTSTMSGRSVMVWESRTPGGAFVGAHVDISALVLLQHELARERQRAEAALEARARFLANMSHELRTPLNAIMGFAEMMRMQAAGPLPEKYLDFAQRIRQSGQFLLSMIVDILDMSKIEAGHMPVDCAAVAPAPAIEEAVTMLAIPAREKGLTLGVELPSPLPEVWAERRRLVQMVQNLLSNAVKFTAEGAVTVRAAAEGAMLRVEVADTGVGMTEEEVRVALTPFQQVRRGDGSDALDGTGLGLPLVKALVEMHGGALSVESARGAGTTVRFTLPLAVGRGGAQTPSPAAASAPRPASQSGASSGAPNR